MRSAAQRQTSIHWSSLLAVRGGIVAPFWLAPTMNGDRPQAAPIRWPANIVRPYGRTALARTYRVTPIVRFVNRIGRVFSWLGIVPRTSFILTVPGRRSGIPHSTPVTLVEDGPKRWLVAPYGDVAWVRNARAAGKVTLSRARRSQTVEVAELGPADSAPVLKAYLAKVGITRPYFDVRPDSPLAAFEAEARRHPVFLIRPALEGSAQA